MPKSVWGCPRCHVTVYAASAPKCPACNRTMLITRATLSTPPAPTVTDELVHALELLLAAYESVLPGVQHIAVQDYELLNEAPLAARRVLHRVREQS